LDSVTDYKDSAGALAGDATARRIQASIRSVTTGAVSLTGNSFTALSDIGITSDRYGKLTLKSSDFQAALTTNSADMKTFFSGNKIAVSLTDNTDSTGLADLIKSTIDIYVNTSSGMLSSRETQIDSEIDDIADDRLDIVERMSALEARYTRQFTAMDTLVGQLKGTSDFLTNQMDAIKAAANR
jgi:flagellar hook-associated protein 2